MAFNQKLQRFGEIRRELSYLLQTSAPNSARWSYLKGAVSRKWVRCYQPVVDDFRSLVKGGRFSNDWFSNNIPHWLESISKTDFANRPISALEIGSWQGMSSLFILDTFPKAHLTCVDTWEGADEHTDQNSHLFTSNIAQDIQGDFDFNLRDYANRLTKFRGTSFNFFNSHDPKELFDLIYVDGSHYSDDVLIDALKGFQLLKPNGLMIFDDYLFGYYKRATDNPASAINSFLKLKAGLYELECVHWQVIVRKN